MSDVAIIAATVKTTLAEIAKQASALGTGLQNAAPGETPKTPNNSIQYLYSIADIISKKIEEHEALFTVSNPMQKHSAP